MCLFRGEATGPLVVCSRSPIDARGVCTCGTVNTRFDSCRPSTSNLLFLVVSLRKPQGGGKIEWYPETVTSNKDKSWYIGEKRLGVIKRNKKRSSVGATDVSLRELSIFIMNC